MGSWISYLVSLVTLFCLIFLTTLGVKLDWFSLSINSFLVSACFDYINMVPLIMVMSISFLVLLWSRFYMDHTSSQTLFYSVLFLFIISMMTLILSDSFLIIFIGWEGLGITSFVLIIYYQNWSSFQGGLLTLLTNRIGDGVLMLSFGYWILQFYFLKVNLMSSMLFGVMFLSLTFTKSAQFPFTSWLPAAMAAPTPVSALVHSSTLVTAGVWLMIKYNNKMFTNSLLFLIFGISTLMLASMSAMMETDGKKIVALSTLSQLGLMFLALASGGYFVCLFHLVMHAFAKANLFLVMGNLIHFRFSLQDIRFMGAGFQSSSMLIMSLISIFSLSGVTFTSGFFSKDLVLMSEYSGLNSMLIIVLIMCIVSLTFAYCLKLLQSLFMTVFSTVGCNISISSMASSLVLSLLSLSLGFIFMKNMGLCLVAKTAGAYWMFLMIIFCIISLNLMFWSKLFISQQKIISKMNFLFLSKSKTMNGAISGFYESNYLLTSFISLLSSSVSFRHVMFLISLMMLLMSI